MQPVHAISSPYRPHGGKRARAAEKPRELPPLRDSVSLTAPAQLSEPPARASRPPLAAAVMMTAVFLLTALPAPPAFAAELAARSVLAGAAAISDVEPMTPPAPTSQAARMRTMREVERLDGGFTTGEAAVPQLNSDLPEIITSFTPEKGIAISTLSPEGRRVPGAHLNHSFDGDFRILSMRQNRTGMSLYESIALHNPGDGPVTVTVKALASRTTTDAPYTDLRPDGTPRNVAAEDPAGDRVEGPGEAASSALLRGVNDGQKSVAIAPGETVIIKTSRVRTGDEIVTMAEVHASKPVQAAIVYNRTAATTAQVKRQLDESGLLELDPRYDHDPSPPEETEHVVYSRVNGIAASSTFNGRLSNTEDHGAYLITGEGEQKYALNTKKTNTLGTGVDDAAAIVARTPRSAWASHGNYGALFELGGAFTNATSGRMRLRLFLETPADPNGNARGSLRNTVEVSTGADPTSFDSVRYIHVNETQGTRQSSPLTEIVVEPGQTRHVRLRGYYAPNNMPPQILRVETKAAS